MNFYSKIHTKLSPNRLCIIAKEDSSKRSFIIFLVQVVCMKIVKNTCPFCTKSVYKNSIYAHPCSKFVGDRDKCLKTF